MRFFWIPVILKKDTRHQDALTAASTCRGRFITTDLVLVEFANSLSLPSFRSVVVASIERIKTDTATTVIPFTQDGMDRALTLFKSRHDKSWGLIDCFSFVVMKENGYGKHSRLMIIFDKLVLKHHCSRIKKLYEL